MNAAGMDTVIVPCAGAGSRLGLAFGKELAPLGPGRALIDATLDLLVPHAGRLRLVLVISEGREATIGYVRQRCEQAGLALALVHQGPEHQESTGAVRAAAPWFSQANLVLLPDQVLDSPQPHLLLRALEEIRTGAGFCFLAAPEHRLDRLASDGALRVEPRAGGLPGRLLDYADKPGHHAADAFNAVWFAYTFAAHTAEQALDVLHTATLGSGRPKDLGPLAGCPVIETSPFADLGTWPVLRAYLTTSTQPEPTTPQRVGGRR